MDARKLIEDLKKKNPKTFKSSVSKIKDSSFRESVLFYTSFLPLEVPHLQRLWHLTNDVMQIPKCPICGALTRFKDGSGGYTKFCSGSCEIKNKWLKTNDEKKKQIYDKQRMTNLERYGNESSFASEEVKNKIKKTFQEKYGENVTNPTQVKEINDRVKKSIKNRFGVENPGQTEKAKQTRIEKFGSENPFSSKEIQAKIRETNLKRYGVKYVAQSPDIFDKMQKWRSYEYTASNGINYLLQGYEKFALEDLLKIYDTEDILTNRSDIRKIFDFEYTFEKKKRKYYPDFYIKSANLIIEVKSAFSLQKEFEKNLKKKESVISMGVNFEFWVYRNDGTRLM